MEQKPIEVLVFVSGGNIQGASATVPVNFIVYDKDNWDVADDDERKEMGSPEQWDAMIKRRTKSGEIVSVY